MKVTRTLVITAIGIAAGAGIPMEAAAAATNGVAACAKATSPGTWPEGVGKQETRAVDVVFRNCSVNGRENIKLDQYFMKLERYVAPHRK